MLSYIDLGRWLWGSDEEVEQLCMELEADKKINEEVMPPSSGGVQHAVDNATAVSNNFESRKSQQKTSLESPCSTASTGSYRDCYWWDTLLHSDSSPCTHLPQVDAMTTSRESGSLSSSNYYSIQTLSATPSPDGQEVKPNTPIHDISVPNVLSRTYSYDDFLLACRRRKRNKIFPLRSTSTPCTPNTGTKCVNFIDNLTADGITDKNVLKEISVNDKSSLTSLALEEEKQHVLHCNAQQKQESSSRAKRPDRLQLDSPIFYNSGHRCKKMTTAQDNVVKECWIEDMNGLGELSIASSSPTEPGEERTPPSAFTSEEDLDTKSIMAPPSVTARDLSLESTKPFAGSDLFTWLSYVVDESSSTSPGYEDIIHLCCSQLVKLGVLQSAVATPIGSRTRIKHADFELDEQYQWTTSTYQYEREQKLKKLRHHNNHLKSRLHKQGDRQGDKTCRTNDQQETNCKCSQSTPCQIEVHTEGKTKTSVSLPTTVLSISTLTSDSGSHISLSINEPSNKTLNSELKDQKSSFLTSPLSCDSFTTAPETPNQISEDRINHSSSPISVEDKSTTTDFLTEPERTKLATFQISVDESSNASADRKSKYDAQTSFTDDMILDSLCHNCQQLMSARSRLSNASIDSGLSQSCMTFPTCNLAGSESSSIFQFHQTSLDEESTTSSAADDLITVQSNAYADCFSASTNQSVDKTRTTISLIPPPPPPLLQKPVPRKKMIKPRVCLKPLHWRRILVHSNKSAEPKPVTLHKTIWDKLEEPRIDADEIEELFSTDINQNKVISTLARRKNFKKVLDRKRSQNLGIVLSSIRQPFSEIKEALINYNVSFLAIDTWRSIYEARGSEKELAEIQDEIESNPRCVLDKPEQFLYNLNNLPFGIERINCFLLEAQYEEAINSINAQLDNMAAVCDHMTNSKSIEQLLSLLLAVGNYLNAGNESRGRADGFALDVLPKLKNVRGKKQMTVLHYIASKYRLKHGIGKGPLDAPLPPIIDLVSASSVCYTDLNHSLSKLNDQLSECQVLMSKVETTLTEQTTNQAFFSIVSSFVRQSTESVQNLFTKLEESRSKFISTCQFFSAPTADCMTSTPEEFFEPWLAFSRDLNEVWSMRTHPLPSRASAHF